MRTREELAKSFRDYKDNCTAYADFPTAIMEVLLDIRELLQQNSVSERKQS